MTQEELQAKYDHLIDLVRKVRGSQKEFFKYRARVDLEKSRYHERRLDSFINDEVKKQKSKQQDLF